MDLHFRSEARNFTHKRKSYGNNINLFRDCPRVAPVVVFHLENGAQMLLIIREIAEANTQTGGLSLP